MNKILALAMLLPFLSGAALTSKEWNTGVYTCDAQWKQMKWTNDTGRTLIVKKASAWTGVGPMSGRADIEVTVRTTLQGILLVSFAWDRYANPSAPHTLTQDFGEDWVEIPPGDGITAWYRCARTADAVPKGHHVFGIWYHLAD